ncbi:MAG: hypothetical protein ACFB10_01220 [Salibacteraceae bacterium]
MRFKVVPVLAMMAELYGQPRSMERFQSYIAQLTQGSRGDLKLPISGFNPMAKEHARSKLQELLQLEAEDHAEKELSKIPLPTSIAASTSISVVLNLADDLQGGWTNRYTTDYDSKFKLNALIERSFCTPYFWTSEAFTTEIIRERVLEAAFRTVYNLYHPRPKTLADMLAQEVFVFRKIAWQIPSPPPKDVTPVKAVLDKHADTEDYSLCFNFFYGARICETLHYPPFGLPDYGGFHWAQHLAKKG